MKDFLWFGLILVRNTQQRTVMADLLSLPLQSKLETTDATKRRSKKFGKG